MSECWEVDVQGDDPWVKDPVQNNIWGPNEQSTSIACYAVACYAIACYPRPPSVWDGGIDGGQCVDGRGDAFDQGFDDGFS